MAVLSPRSFRTYVIYGALACALLLIALYTGFELRHLIRGPVLTIAYPLDGAVLEDPLMTLEGSAKNIAHLTLNGRQVFVDAAGALVETLLLSQGQNVISIEADDRFGRTTVRLLRVTVSEPSP